MESCQENEKLLNKSQLQNVLSDEQVEPQITSNITISSLKKYSNKLLANIKNLKDIVDIDTLAFLLKQISDYKCVTQYKDPLLYVSYIYSGSFKAAGYCRLSEYLALTVSGQKFVYLDTLGKHLEVDFNTNVIKYEYVDEDDYSDDDTSDFDEPRIKYNYNIYIKILENLKRYMYSLPYVNIEIYKTSRYKELEEYTNKLFKSLILTTNPIIQ